MNEIDSCKSKYELALLAKLAQQTERYDEMVKFANKLFLLEEELTSAERNLCASAYKNLVSSRRAELKVLDAVEQKLPNKGSESVEMQAAIKKYRSAIRK